MGICTGAGYTGECGDRRPAHQSRGTVSAVNIGQIFRNGFTNDIKSADAVPLLANGANARSLQKRPRSRLPDWQVNAASSAPAPRLVTRKGEARAPSAVARKADWRWAVLDVDLRGCRSECRERQPARPPQPLHKRIGRRCTIPPKAHHAAAQKVPQVRARDIHCKVVSLQNAPLVLRR
jgi:hypothetical protein